MYCSSRDTANYWGRITHLSHLLVAKIKHTKMHSSRVTHWSKWENQVLLLGAKKQCWPIQLKYLPLLHPHTHQLGLFCLAWKLSVNKIGVAVKWGISSQRTVRRTEERGGQQEDCTHSYIEGNWRSAPMRAAKLGLGRRQECSPMQSRNIGAKTKHFHNLNNTNNHTHS